MAKFLNREAILKADDLKTQDVEVPEWGGSVRVRSLTGAERDKFEATNYEIKDNKTVMKLENVRARLVSLAAIDGEGKSLFTPEDVAALGKKNAAALDRLFTVAQELSGLREKDLKEAEKN